MELKVLASESDHACRVAGLKTGNLSGGVAAYPPAEWSTQAVVEANVLGATPRGRALAAATPLSPSPRPTRSTSSTTAPYSPGLERQRMATAAASTRTALALNQLTRAQSPRRAEAYPPSAWSK